MTSARPESVDLFGLTHRYGCPASRVTSRPASITGRTWHTCADCGAGTITFDHDLTASTTTTTTTRRTT